MALGRAALDGVRSPRGHAHAAPQLLQRAVLGACGLSAWSERGGAEVWITQPADDDGLGLAYINLLQNPERFTGYAGPSAHRVWRAVYDENCFGLGGAAAGADTCLEKRVFFRLMSGLQASIATHIAREYYDERRGWHENVPLFVARVGTHPERLDAMCARARRARARAAGARDIRFPPPPPPPPRR